MAPGLSVLALAHGRPRRRDVGLSCSDINIGMFDLICPGSQIICCSGYILVTRAVTCVCWNRTNFEHIYNM